ncbi:sensor histidine kinase [Shewanella sp. JM162201]|uniref:Sensor histidine kinase n=1 Tax=Shewanella jiangmenensis TaxID=2837387 RepID=A0ABS5V4C3_9GAMM|nr:histidine kinase [Shewanella jiangmenensis]MBT1445312.1 sensor histidine kinase [Shewanella jiangmenensis]
MKDPIELEHRLAKYYLANLVFYFLPLLLSKPSTLDVAISLALMVPFLYGYFRAYRSSRATAWMPILLMTLCGAIATPFNSGSMSLFSFAGFFIGFFYRGNTYLLWLAGMGALMLALHWVLGFNNYYFLLFGGAITLGISLIGLAQAKREEAKRVLAQSETEIRRLAQALERERIARDLHDIMGHHLASIALKADLASRLLAKGDHDSCRSELNDLTQIARDSLAQVRAAVGQYKRKDIADIINDLGQRLREKGLGVDISGDLPEMSAALERELGLILTELVSNILRHSDAGYCRIQTTQRQDNLIIEVADDGKAGKIDEGNGLKGIRERLAVFSGTLHIDTQSGFHASIVLPLAKIEK